MQAKRTKICSCVVVGPYMNVSLAAAIDPIPSRADSTVNNRSTQLRRNEDDGDQERDTKRPKMRNEKYLRKAKQIKRPKNTVTAEYIEQS